MVLAGCRKNILASADIAHSLMSQMVQPVCLPKAHIRALSQRSRKVHAQNWTRLAPPFSIVLTVFLLPRLNSFRETILEAYSKHVSIPRLEP